MLNSKIKVFARIKPSSDSRHHHCEIKVSKGDKKKILLLYKDHEKTSNSQQPKLHEFEEFLFENVFTENASQEVIYNHMAKPVVERAIEGFNGTIMAYGQTGTGKTHTICGGADLSMKGIIPRAFKHVFHRMKEMKQTNVKVYLSAMEIYNDHAFDLLTERITKFGLPRLNSKQIIPRNLKMTLVTNMHDLGKLLKRATNNRIVRNTIMNEVSSRSHCIFSLHLYQNVNSCISKSKIHMIDLSGSEKIGKKRPSGVLFNESRHINLSLHYIELVIRALSDKSQDHIPYRNSMITSFLRDSLGGNSNTVMIFTLSLDPKFFEETVLTCRFAQRVSLISNKMLKMQKSLSEEKNGEIRRNSHKGINCKLDWSDSSTSNLRDGSDEMTTFDEIASLKSELEASKRKISELTDQLQNLKNNRAPLQKLLHKSIVNGFDCTSFQNMAPLIANKLLRNSNEESSKHPHESEESNKKMANSDHQLYLKIGFCTLCGKKIKQIVTALSNPANHTGSDGKSISQEVCLNGNLHIKSKIKTRLKKSYPCENINKYSLIKKDSSPKPVLYFIYELIGLSLPSKNIISGQPYTLKEIELYCEFLPKYLNIGSFKKEYYDKHFDLVDKEFQGCYKLNKKMSSLDKMKMKLNEMECYSENNSGEREQLEKLIQEEDNKLNHSKAMLEVIRNERLELLKYVKHLRTKLVSKFHHDILHNYVDKQNRDLQASGVSSVGSKFYCNSNIFPESIIEEVQKQVGGVFLIGKSDEHCNNKLTDQVKSMPDISQCLPDEIKAESKYHSMNLQIFSRSDTIINSSKVPGKTTSYSSTESRISAYSKVKKKTISSEDSYISFSSGINSGDPSSGIYSLSEESVEPSSLNCC